MGRRWGRGAGTVIEEQRVGDRDGDGGCRTVGRGHGRGEPWSGNCRRMTGKGTVVEEQGAGDGRGNGHGDGG